MDRHPVYVVDLAFRMLENIQDAEDVVQDAFGRLLASDIDSIDDIRGWLVVVVSRLCLDQLRSAVFATRCATAISTTNSRRRQHRPRRSTRPIE